MKNQNHRPERRTVKGSELLAIDSRHLIKGPDAFFWLFAPANPAPRRVGDTCVIYVRGALEHHDEGWGCANYESIVSDVKCAYEGDEENEPCKRVVLCVDSPGGVVSGLYECVDELKRLAKGRELIASVEGLCASAAYAVTCACSKVYATRSSIMGSVGVIATMYSQRRRDQEQGFDFVTITSGKRKADGHPHVAISDAAIRAEEKRVRKFAEGFFEIVSEARDFDPEPDEAGLFVGKDAVSAGYADEIGTLDELLEAVAQSDTTPQPNTAQGDTMRLSALIKKTKAAIKAEKDAEKKAALRLKLAAYTQTLADSKRTYEKEVEETTDEPEEEEEEIEDEEEEEEDEPSDEKEDDDPPEEEEEEEGNETDREEMDDEEEKKAIAAARKLKGKSGKAVLNALLAGRAKRRALRGEVKEHRKNSKAIAEIRAENEKRDRDAVIDSAMAAGRVTPGEAKKLRKMSTIEVGAFLAARTRPIVNVAPLAPNLKESASMLSSQMGNSPPAEVQGEITKEMREAAQRMSDLTGGKVKVEDVLKDYNGIAKKEGTY